MDASYLDHSSRRRRETTGGSRLSVILLVLFVAAMAVRVYCAVSTKGYLSDQQYFLTWMKTVDEYGLGKAYAANEEINYPPVLLVLLGIYKYVLDGLGLEPVIGTLSIKLPMILFDAAAIGAVIWITRKKSAVIRLSLTAFFALNPVFILDGAVWGQVDMLHSFLMVTAVLLLPKRPGWAGIVYAVACLAKFQSIVLAPVFGIYLLREWFGQKRDIRPLFFTVVGFLAVFVAALLYFTAYGTLGAMLKGSYFSAVGFYPYVTLNAMNIWYYWIGTPPDTMDSTWIASDVTLRLTGFALLGIAVLLTSVYMLLSRQPPLERLLKAAVMMNFSFFMLPTEIHERYSMPALVFAAVVLMVDARWRTIAILLTLTGFLNMLMPFTGVNPHMGMGLVWLNVFLLYRMFADGFREAGAAERIAGWLERGR